MRLRRRTTPIVVMAAVLGAVLTLTGCRDGADDPPVAESTWTPSGTTEPPTSSPTADPPVEPELPAAATKATEAGARAFIKHYWELINYAQVTGDVKALKRLSGPRCDGCNGGISIIEELYSSGGRATGGEYALSIQELSKVSVETGDLLAYEGQLSVENYEQLITEGDGATSTQRPGTSSVLVYVHWVAEAWRMDVMDVR